VHLGEWPYSNYLEWVEQRRATLVNRAFVRQYFSTAADYEAFVISEVDPSLEQRLQAYYLVEKRGTLAEGLGTAFRVKAPSPGGDLLPAEAIRNLRKGL